MIKKMLIVVVAICLGCDTHNVVEPTGESFVCNKCDGDGSMFQPLNDGTLLQEKCVRCVGTGRLKVVKTSSE